jgi:hypothetical protein
VSGGDGTVALTKNVSVIRASEGFLLDMETVYTYSIPSDPIFVDGDASMHEEKCMRRNA